MTHTDTDLRLGRAVGQGRLGKSRNEPQFSDRRFCRRERADVQRVHAILDDIIMRLPM